MEDIAPTHHFILVLKEELRASSSIGRIVRDYIRWNKNIFTPLLIAWLSASEKGEVTQWMGSQLGITEYQRVLFELMNYALKGGGILPLVDSLELEVRQASQLQIEDHLSKLPFKLLIPLLLFQFPALLLLILGPLLIHLLREVQ